MVAVEAVSLMGALRAALLTAVLALAAAACQQPDIHDQVRAATVRVEFADNVCSGTAIGPQEILTATHCIRVGVPLRIDGKEVDYTVQQNDGRDHVVLTVTEIRKVYARIGEAPKTGDIVFIWGQPLGLENILRYGRVAGKRGRDYLFDINAIQGDSGAAIFNRRGEIVGIVSAVGGGGPFLLAIAYPLELQ
jgi:S1-C subfamily serine protease